MLQQPRAIVTDFIVVVVDLSYIYVSIDNITPIVVYFKQDSIDRLPSAFICK